MISRIFPLLLVGALALLAGCRESQPPEPIASSEVPTTVNSAFNSASPEVRAAAQEAVAALQKDEQSMALEALEALARKGELTPEQREAATKAAVSVRAGIVEAAAKGDAAAKAFLEAQSAKK
jgi:hypothetical protein